MRQGPSSTTVACTRPWRRTARTSVAWLPSAGRVKEQQCWRARRGQRAQRPLILPWPQRQGSCAGRRDLARARPRPAPMEASEEARVSEESSVWPMCAVSSVEE